MVFPFTVTETLPQFFWLTNYIETVLSNANWKPMTVATLAYQYRRLLEASRLKDEFLAKVMAIGQKMMPGDPLDPKTQMGAMVDENQTKRVMGYIDAGKKEGAKLVKDWNVHPGESCSVCHR